MNDLNRLTISGTIHGRPEVRVSKNGKEFASATIKLLDTYNGKMREVMIPVSAFGVTAQDLLNGQHGDAIIAEGKLSSFRKEYNGKEFFNVDISLSVVKVMGGSADDLSFNPPY